MIWLTAVSSLGINFCFVLQCLFSAVLRITINCLGFPHPTAQDVLCLVELKYLKKLDASNGFVDWLVNVKHALIIATETGSLIITVKCSSLEMLQELWRDYESGVVDEMAQNFLVTKDVLNELNLTEARLKTTIPDEEYKACQEQLLRYQLYSGGLEGLLQPCF